MKLILSCLLLSVMLMHLASCQQCTVPMSALQCGDNQQPSTHSSYNHRGLPGKRGAPGIKGEKGETGNILDVRADFTRNAERLDRIEEKLNQVEELCNRTRMEILEQQTADRNKLRSCQDIPTKLHHRRNGIYTIQPNDAVRPFTVECSFQGSVVITSVGHDTEEETEVTCDKHRCHRREIQYNTGIPQIRALIELIGNCRQFIKYRCHGSILLRKGDQYSGWLSWNGEMQVYWGGADQQPNSCACGVRGNCVDSAWKCNCDKNDNVERADLGYLVHEDHLPVHSLFFGDAGGSGEYGFYTLGKLECMG